MSKKKKPEDSPGDYFRSLDEILREAEDKLIGAYEDYPDDDKKEET